MPDDLRPGAPPALEEGHRGLFVVVEGVEGAGKTTQVDRLLRWMRARGVAVRRAREPGGTPVGEAVRDLLLNRGELEIGAETELLLMLAARAAFVQDVVLPALSRGETLVADRFELSTFAYQGYGRGLALDEVRRLNHFATGGLRPDLVLVLDLPAALGRSRQVDAGKAADRIEASGDRFLDRVARGYRTLAAADDRAVLVDARADADRVERALRALLEARFPELFGAAGGSSMLESPQPRSDPE